MSAPDPTAGYDLSAFQRAWGSVVPELAAKDDASEAISRAIDRAALSGPFDLFELAGSAAPAQGGAEAAGITQAGTGQVEGTLAYPVRTALAEASEPVPGDPARRRWLRPDRREAALRALIARPKALAELLREPAPEGDETGAALRALLAGSRPTPRRVPQERLAPLITALGLLEGLPVPQGQLPFPDLHALRREATRREAAARRNPLTSSFVGRKREREAIAALVDDPDERVRVLVIDGPGGIGKSTLLARVAADLSARTPPTPVFTFDFDRPSLDPSGPGLLLEFTRQLGALLPAQAATLSAIREQIWRGQYLRGAGPVMKGDFAISVWRTIDEFAGPIRDVIAEGGLDQHPLLVVLDTIEVVAGQGEASLEALGQWVGVLHYQLGLRRLRVLMAGRAARVAARRMGNAAVMHLPALNAAEARRLLRRLGLDATRAREAAKVLGGNPLVLRLGARALSDNPDLPASELATMGETLVHGVLYRRILDHLGQGPDDPLRRLALPALTLRVITPALLGQVVAPAVGLEGMMESEARALFDRLVTHAWVAEREAEGRARHRADLRSEALRLILHDDSLAPVAARVQRLALAHFRRADDPDLSPDEARLEAVYHALMTLPPGEDLAEADAALVPAALRGDFTDLPAHAAALARVHSGSAPERGDLALVPAHWREAVMARLGWEAIDAERPLEALALAPEDDAPRVWRLTAWVMAAEWQDPAAGRALAALDLAAAPPAAFAGPGGIAGLTEAIATRESEAQAGAAGAWLRLLRGDHPDRAAPFAPSGMDQRTRIATLQQVTAQALTLLGSHDADEAAWAEVSERGLAAMPRGAAPRGPALRDEMARFSLLLWAGGRVPRVAILTLERGDAGQTMHAAPFDPEAQEGRDGGGGRAILTMRPAMVIATPAQLARYQKLVAADPAAAQQLEDLRAALPEDATSAVLTGHLAGEVAAAIEAAAPDIERFEAAGIGPDTLIHGLMHEFRTTARALLRPFITDADGRAALADALPSLLRISEEDDFLPADLQPEAWARAAGRFGGIGAISALTDWAGRTGRLSAVMSKAGELAAAPEQAARFQRLATAIKYVEVALASSVIQ